jgi:hypothetical protein
MISIEPLNGRRKKSRPTSNPDFENSITSFAFNLFLNNPITAEASAVLQN